jgi:hypothetical protein
MDAAMPFPLNLSLGYAVLLFQSIMRYPYLRIEARFGQLWASINAKRWKKLLDPGVARKLRTVHKAKKTAIHDALLLSHAFGVAMDEN